jgi:hypothetical protein
MKSAGRLQGLDGDSQRVMDLLLGSVNPFSVFFFVSCFLCWLPPWLYCYMLVLFVALFPPFVFPLFLRLTVGFLDP